ncbi:MAG TPA: hypothetical protein VGH20_18435 [Myxococcales bacterium]
MKRVKVFSDSLFFFFDGRSPVHGQPPILTSPYFLPRVAARLSRRLWMYGLPHRGAIAYGDCYLGEEPDTFLGDAIVTAHEWEQCQKWFGISVAPRSLDAAAAAFNNLPGLYPSAVPTKSGDQDTIVININDVLFGDVETEGISPERDAIISGFNKAWQAAKRNASRGVVQKYRSTASMWRQLGLKPPLDEGDAVFSL